MKKTFEGKTTGTVYRYLPKKAKNSLIAITVVSVMVFSALIGCAYIVNTSEPKALPLLILAAVICAIVAEAYVRSVFNDNRKLFQRYIILEQTTNENGSQSFLIQWLKDGHESWYNEDGDIDMTKLTWG